MAGILRRLPVVMYNVDMNRLIVTYCMASIILLLCNAGTGMTADWKNVLILNSYHQGYKWTDDETRGMLDALAPEKNRIKVTIQYLDTKRLSDSRYFRNLRDLFARKYQRTEFNVIIAADNDAFTFLKKYRDDLFPGTPVVFCGINYLKEHDLEGAFLFTGVNEDADIAAGIDLVLRLHPDTREIIAVTDTSVTGRAVRGEFEKVLPRYAGRVRFEILDHISMADLRSKLSRLENGSIVFYTFFSRDKNGRVFEYDESTELITTASSVPVYGAWDFSFGFGIVGGILTSGYLQGKTAGQIARRILNGEDPAAIPVIWHSPGQAMFDYAVMGKFGINKRQLPADTVFINEPPSALSIDKQVVWTVFWGTVFIIGLGLAYIVIQKRAELRLRASEEQFRTLITNLHVGVYRATPEPNGRYIQVNPAMVKILGYESAEELLQTPVVHLYENQEDRTTLLNDIMREGTVRDRELAFRKKDGSSIIVSSTATAVCDEHGVLQWIDGVMEDVTEKRNLEKQLRHAQKMEAIGTLAGGIAHDFNNILTAVLGYAQMISVRMESSDPLQPYAQQIIHASEKAAALTQSLLAFSRKQVITPKVQNLNDIVSHLYPLLQRIIGEDVILRTHLADRPLMIHADALQIEQVLMNLAANARDAMPRGGRITIETGVAPCAETDDREPPEIQEAKEYGVLVFSDTGRGMDEATRLRIFEPFFTTKEIGRGTGLGLSMAYGIVKQHGGDITVTSVPDQGTTFRVYLPLIEPETEQDRKT